MRMVVLDEIKRRHEERKKSAPINAAHLRNASVAGETGQDKVAGGQEELRRDHAANEIASGTKKQVDDRNKCHFEALATSVTASEDTCLATALKSEHRRAADRNDERCPATAREASGQVIQSPPPCDHQRT